MTNANEGVSEAGTPLLIVQFFIELQDLGDKEKTQKTSIKGQDKATHNRPEGRASSDSFITILEALRYCRESLFLS